MIDDSCGMVKESLRTWYRTHQNSLPEKLLFYRDGVSESQFADVKKLEL